MRVINHVATAAVVAAIAVSAMPVGAAAAAPTKSWFKNCSTFNLHYPHGVGRVGAHDKTKSGKPVTTFLRSDAIYKLVLKWNDDLDRDHDGIACEKA